MHTRESIHKHNRTIELHSLNLHWFWLTPLHPRKVEMCITRTCIQTSYVPWSSISVRIDHFLCSTFYHIDVSASSTAFSLIQGDPSSRTVLVAHKRVQLPLRYPRVPWCCDFLMLVSVATGNIELHSSCRELSLWGADPRLTCAASSRCRLPASPSETANI